MRRLVRRGSKPAEALELSQVLGVKLAALVVRHRPNGADRFAMDTERNEKDLYGGRRCAQQIGVTPFEVLEEQRRVAVQYVAAGSEITRRAAAHVRFPRTRDRRPVKSLFAIVRRQQTHAGRIGLKDLQDRVSQVCRIVRGESASAFASAASARFSV